MTEIGSLGLGLTELKQEMVWPMQARARTCRARKPNICVNDQANKERLGNKKPFTKAITMDDKLLKMTCNFTFGSYIC